MEEKNRTRAEVHIPLLQLRRLYENFQHDLRHLKLQFSSPCKGLVFMMDGTCPNIPGWHGN